MTSVDFRDCVELELQDAGHQHHSHDDHAHSVHGHEPHTRQPIGITELDPADRRAATDDDGRKRARVEDGTDGTTRDQELLLVDSFALRPEPDSHHARHIGGEHEQIECCHSRRVSRPDDRAGGACYRRPPG
jgi:hypothetical protein